MPSARQRATGVPLCGASCQASTSPSLGRGQLSGGGEVVPLPAVTSGPSTIALLAGRQARVFVVGWGGGLLGAVRGLDGGMVMV